MKRPTPVWLAFSGALAIVLAVMAFFTVRMVRFERAEAKAQASAALEETIRLALWRMDSAAALLLNPSDAPSALSGNDAPALPQSAQLQQRFEPEYQGKISQQEFTQRNYLNSNRLTPRQRRMDSHWEARRTVTQPLT